MPNDAIRDQLIRLADLAKDIRELKARAEVKEEEFKAAFTEFFNANREYVFAHSLFDDGDNPPFRYHDLPKAQSIYNPPRMTITCSCGSRVDSCDECGDGHYSYFTITDDAQILRVRMDKHASV